jgi:DNA-binding transcriptional LysR family regulator
MFLRQFKYLIAVAEEQHFGRAAARCCVTQPSLSSGIKQLELELGVTIFLRGRGQRFLGLTPEGERVTKWARHVIAHCEAMRDELDVLRDDLKGEIRIGAMPSMSPVLPTLISKFVERHPGVKADVQFLGIDEMKLGLSRFSLDVGLTYLDHEDFARLNTLSLFAETLKLLVPDTPEFAGRQTITWRELADLPIAMLRPTMRERQFVNQVFEKVGVRPKPRVESESIMHLIFQVQFAQLVTIVPGHFGKMPGLNPGTRMLELVEPAVSQKVGLVWTEGEPTIPMAGALVKLLVDMQRSGELARSLGDLTVLEPERRKGSGVPTKLKSVAV